MSQPTLRTERLELVPLADSHLELEVELDSDPEVLRYLYASARTREEARQAHRARLGDAERTPGLGFWVGFVSGQFVGWWLLRPPTGPDQPQVAGAAELGYRLLRRRWRQGLASEGSRELLRYGFRELGLQRIFAQTMAVNEGSRAVMAAVGMTYVRTFSGHFSEPLPGAEQDEVEYALTRQQWERSRAVDVTLHRLDEPLLELLLHAAVSGADPDEVMPPWDGPAGWTSARRAGFLAFHRSRSVGTSTPVEATYAIVLFEQGQAAVVGAARLATSEAGTEAGLWLTREARGRGVAGAAFSALLGQARVDGIDVVVARTTRANAEARALLQRTGGSLTEQGTDVHARFDLAGC